MRQHDQGQGVMHALKAEVYDYMQSKIKQLAKSYSPKFTQLFKQVEATEEKLRQMNDLNGDTDFQFEEFKDQIGLKHKLLLDSVSNQHKTIGQLDQRIKDYYTYMLKMKKQVTELTKENQEHKELVQKPEEPTERFI